MSYLLTATEYVAINDVPLNTPAWTMTNLHELWSGPPTRGVDRILPSANGVRAYPRRIDAWRVSLQLVVYGDSDWTGAAATNPRDGLWANVEHLRTNAFDPPPGPGDGTVPLEMVLPDGSSLTTPVTVEGFVVGSAINWFAINCTADVSIPAGTLT